MNRHQRRATKRQSIPFIRCTREQLATAAIRLDQAEQPGAAALMREAMRGGLAIVGLTDRQAAADVANLPLDRSTVLIVGDDDYATTGPAGWRCAETIAAWAACAVVHGAGATAATYLEAARGAREAGRCALIETDAAHAAEWVARFAGKPVLVIVPREGGHPVRTGAVH